jgi:hypothetical protein
LLATSVASIASIVACKGQAINARSNFVEDDVQQVAAAAWNGERIEIDNAGVTAAGGLSVSATATDRPVATARMLAVADTYDKANADRTITAATQTFTIATDAGVTSVQCAHGTTNGSADATESGCDTLGVSVPTGTSDKRIALAARSGNGKVSVAVDGAQLAELTVTASHGAMDVKTATTQGATITVVSETGDDVTLRLPPDFQADAIALDGASGMIDTSAFADVKNGSGRGQADAGAKLITVRSAATDGGAGGRIVLVPIAP